MKRHQRFAAFGWLALGMILAAGPLQAITYTWDNISVVHSNRCLDIPSGSKDNGVQLQQWDCNQNSQQRFLPEIRSQDNGSITVALKVLTSNKCLDVFSYSTVNGGKVVQWDCLYGNNQLWKVIPNGTDGFILQNVHSGKCLDVKDIATGNGVVLQQWDCWNGKNQTFRFKRTLK